MNFPISLFFLFFSLNTFAYVEGETGFLKEWSSDELSHFSVLRHYDSSSNGLFYFGLRWCTHLDRKLTKKTEDAIYISTCQPQMPDVFQKMKDGIFFDKISGTQLTVEKNKYRLLFKNGSEETYNQMGQILSWKTGASEVFVRYAGQLPQSLRDQYGNEVSIVIDGGRIKTLKEKKGQSFEYIYKNNSLAQINKNKKKVVEYKYNGVKSLLSSVVKNEKNFLNYGWDEKGRVASVDKGGCKEVFNYKDSSAQLKIDAQVLCSNKIVSKQNTQFQSYKMAEKTVDSARIKKTNSSGRAQTLDLEKGLVSSIQQENKTIKIVRDRWGRPIQVVADNLSKKNISWSETCPAKIKEMEIVNNKTISKAFFDYDKFCQLSLVKDSTGLDMRMTFDKNSRISKMTDKNGKAQFNYRGQSRQPASITMNGISLNLSYNKHRLVDVKTQSLESLLIVSDKLSALEKFDQYISEVEKL